MVDVDLRGAFPSLESSSTQDAVQAVTPGVTAWTAWVHSSPAKVFLPGGDTHTVDRGAEKGDPLCVCVYVCVKGGGVLCVCLGRRG